MSLNFKKDYLLQDECVLMQPLTQNDCHNLLEISLNEPETWQYSLITAAGEQNLKLYIEQAIQARQNENEYAFVVFDKRTNEFAGSTRFYDIQIQHKTLQLGYTWYGKKFRGTGLNKHCKFLLLNFAFEELNFERVEFRADANNATSIAAMKSIGCTVEGILRSHTVKANGQRRDSIVLSILKDEWENSIRQQLLNKLL